MIKPILFIVLFYISACTNTSNNAANNKADSNAVQSTNDQESLPSMFPDLGVDSIYTFSNEQGKFFLIGFFNSDKVPDTALIVSEKKTGRKALYIHHGGTIETFLLKHGADIGTDFSNFNWVAEFSLISSGTTIWNNVVDGEIVAEDQIPANKRITLKTDGIFVHADEGSGGGIIYFDNGKYNWVQQD